MRLLSQILNLATDNEGPLTLSPQLECLCSGR